MSAQLLAPITFAHAGSSLLAAAPVALPAAIADKDSVLDKVSVLEKVQRVLAESSYRYLRRVHCAYEDGVLTLRGCMPTFYMKQTLQVLVAKVEGVKQIVNLVEVANPAARY